MVALAKLKIVNENLAVSIWEMAADVRKFMQEAEPEIVQAVVTDRHSDDGEAIHAMSVSPVQ